MTAENIGRKGQLRRAAWGAAMFLVAAGLAAWLILTDQPRAWRLFLFVPLWMAGLGLLQAKEKTWVVLASRGLRETDEGLRPVEDPGQRAELRRQARGIRFKTTVLALLVTVGLLLI